jgi:hypothetical protein
MEGVSIGETVQNSVHFSEGIYLPRNYMVCTLQFILLAALLAVLATVSAVPQYYATPFGYSYYGTYAYPYSYGTYLYR